MTLDDYHIMIQHCDRMRQSDLTRRGICVTEKKKSAHNKHQLCLFNTHTPPTGKKDEPRVLTH